MDMAFIGRGGVEPQTGNGNKHLQTRDSDRLTERNWVESKGVLRASR